jgi:Domain of unknown function (DUF4193)
VSKEIDYDSRRRSAEELDEDGLADIRAGGAAAKSPGAEVDEAEAGYELPGAELADEELTGPVIPMQSDEFRCRRCFLVHHRSQLAASRPGQEVCRECSGA